MQITLNQDEIEVAVDRYVRSQINIAENQELTIELKATRGEGGYTANLEIRTVGEAPKAAPKPVQAEEAPEVTETPKKAPKAIFAKPEVVADTPDEDENVDAEEEEEVVEDVADEAPKSKSLFSKAFA